MTSHDHGDQFDGVPVDSADPSLYLIQTNAPGPAGSLPLDAELLLHAPSGDLFGLSQNAGMGWEPHTLRQPEFLILSTQGGIRAPTAPPLPWAITPATGKWAC